MRHEKKRLIARAGRQVTGSWAAHCRTAATKQSKVWGGGEMRVRGERGVMGRQEGRNLEGEGKSLGFMG